MVHSVNIGKTQMLNEETLGDFGSRSAASVAREKVPILDVRKNSGIQCVINENETSSNQSRSTLHSISGHKRAGRSRVSSLHQDKNDHVSTKPLKISSESTDSTLETLNPETKKHRKGQKSCRCSQDNLDTSLHNSVNNINNETETQLSYKSDKRYLANEGNKTSLPHEESNRSIDFSPVASGVSSFYSLENSEESLALTPTESSKISGKMSSLSIRVEQTDGRTHSTLQEENRCSEKSTQSLQGTNSSSQKTNRSTNVSSQGSNKSQDLSIQGRNKSPIISSQMSNSRSHSSWVGSYRNSDGSVHEIYKSTDPSLTTSSRGSSASSRYSRSIISYSDEETTNYNPAEI
ncbi:uncharacterized protein LOC121402034 [Xenopus laevis]|uniref:Uncharacterized protein LOC121402034 n=1 Tax=Xenopus laevis TaxID=8355 RepID=A0A8J1MQI4_XENLA|nr:uncharacterized protein LOC121402034 [Xenopus laevis]